MGFVNVKPRVRWFWNLRSCCSDHIRWLPTSYSLCFPFYSCVLQKSPLTSKQTVQKLTTLSKISLTGLPFRKSQMIPMMILPCFSQIRLLVLSYRGPPLINSIHLHTPLIGAYPLSHFYRHYNRYWFHCLASFGHHASNLTPPNFSCVSRIVVVWKCGH